MKKSLYLLAAAAILVSCDESMIKNDVRDFNAESPIAFNTYAGIQTKADNNVNAKQKWQLESHNTTFNVWAWKFYDGAWVSTPVYKKCIVSYNTGGTETGTYFNWDADTVKFWDKSAEKYYFYAAAPKDAAWVLTGTGDQGKLSYANFTLAGGIENNLSYDANGTVTTEVQSFIDVDDVDLMIAEDNLVPRAKYNKNEPEKVNEVFDHILSRLNVTVALKAGGTIATFNSDGIDTNDVVVKVTDFGITGVSLKNKGSFDEDAALGTTDVLNEGTIKRWNSLGLVGTYDLPGADIKDSVLTANKSLYIAQYLIIPQAITSEVLDRANGKVDTDNDSIGDRNAAHPYLKINYTIGDEPYVAYYNLANAFGKAENDTINFCEGWQNTLNIKLDADAIVFDADVYEWKDETNKDVTIFD